MERRVARSRLSVSPLFLAWVFRGSFRTWFESFFSSPAKLTSEKAELAGKFAGCRRESTSPHNTGRCSKTIATINSSVEISFRRK